MTPDQLRELDEWSELEKRLYAVHGTIPPDGRDPTERYKGKVDPSIDRLIGDLESSIMAGSPQAVSVRAMKRAVGYLRAHAAALEEVERVKAELDRVMGGQQHSLEHANALLTKRAEKAERRAERLQAQVDALMLEYCPDEMTPEQVEEWTRHQMAVAFDRADKGE